MTNYINVPDYGIIHIDHIKAALPASDLSRVILHLENGETQYFAFTNEATAKVFLENIAARLRAKEAAAMPLPWRPFHPDRLKEGAHFHLYNQRENPTLRAVMEVLEDAITGEVDDIGRVSTDKLPRCAGLVQALRDHYQKLRRMVTEQPEAAE